MPDSREDAEMSQAEDRAEERRHEDGEYAPKNDPRSRVGDPRDWNYAPGLGH